MMLSYGFGQRALVGGILVAITCSVVSFFVVVRRMAFVGMGISHAAFGGVAIGILAGINPIVAAGAFCSAVAIGIGWVSKKGKLHEDTTIGVLFAAAMAMGVVLVRLANAYNLDLMSYLFGSILTMSWGDVIALAVLSVLVLSFVFLFFKELIFFAFDEETATASGLPLNITYYGLLIAIALTIVVSLKLVGIVLVSALLVMPAAIGLQLYRNYRGVLAVSVGAGVTSMVLGLFLSSWFDVASGATIVLVLFGFFVLSMVVSPKRSYIAKLRKSSSG